MKTIQYKIPKGYEINNSTSSKTKIVFKKVETKINVNITDKVKTFADACKQIGTTEKKFYQILPKAFGKDIIAYEKLKIIIKALNEGWQPDWNKSNERKYYPYFNMGSSGFGFSNTHYVTWMTDTCVGSRLCFKNRELVEYAGKQFAEIYKDFLT